jgi:oxygen-independent coproporphyrinogen-3 oxidase
MVIVRLNEANFEYDIYGLVKSFFPTQSVEIQYEEGAEPKDSAPKPHEIEEPITLVMNVHYENGRIGLSMSGKTTEVEVDDSNRKDTKNRLKRLIYQALQEYTGRELPWGTLTGIRPTKIALTQLLEEVPEEEIRSYMKETYLTSDEKIDLSMKVVTKEKEMLSKVDYQDGYSLYIGIPFCPSTCLYCSFPSYALASYNGQVERYLQCLEKELQFLHDSIPEKKLTTIYFGGGTPTSLSAEQLDWLLSKVEEYLDLSHLLEYTVEAGRPDSITRDKLEVLKAHGVDRISINPQTMKQETLKLIGRHHTVESIYDAYQMAREVGFETINMDMILGLPGESLEDVEHSLKEVAKLEPDNLTVHSLAIKHSSRLNIEWDKYRNYVMENSDSHMHAAYEVAKELGMKPYYLYRQKNMAGNLENVGFSVPGHEGLYNVLIMEEKQTIMALGAGSACKYVTDGGKTVTRSENVKDVTNYIERIDEMIERKRNKLEEIAWL